MRLLGYVDDNNGVMLLAGGAHHGMFTFFWCYNLWGKS